MSSPERRTDNTRKQVKPVPVYFQCNGIVYKGMMSDISKQGMRMVTLHPRPADSQNWDEQMKFTIWTKKRMHSIAGKIRWMEFGPDGCEIGVQVERPARRAHRPHRSAAE